MLTPPKDQVGPYACQIYDADIGLTCNRLNQHEGFMLTHMMFVRQLRTD